MTALVQATPIFMPHSDPHNISLSHHVVYRRVKDALGIPSSLYKAASGGQQRLRNRVGRLLDVEELVMSALTLPTPPAKDGR